METLFEMIVFFGIWGGMALIVAQMSRDRDIGFWTLFAVSVFFTPFIAIIFALLSKKKSVMVARPQNQERAQEPETEPDIGNDPFWKRFSDKKDK